MQEADRFRHVHALVKGLWFMTEFYSPTYHLSFIILVLSLLCIVEKFGFRGLDLVP